MTVVAASGNDGTDTKYYPGALPGVVAVGAVDGQGTVAPFTSYGAQITVVAPGVNILSSFARGRYAVASGTSQASPCVAGAVALLLKKDDDDEEQVKAPSDESFWKVSGAGFMLILVAEFGDLTQIMTANLAARYDDPLSVGLGAVLALWAVAALGILGGRTLMKFVPLKLITRVAALLMLGLAAFSLYEALAP